MEAFNTADIRGGTSEKLGELLKTLVITRKRRSIYATSGWLEALLEKLVKRWKTPGKSRKTLEKAVESKVHI